MFLRVCDNLCKVMHAFYFWKFCKTIICSLGLLKGFGFRAGTYDSASLPRVSNPKTVLLEDLASAILCCFPLPAPSSFLPASLTLKY